MASIPSAKASRLRREEEKRMFEDAQKSARDQAQQLIGEIVGYQRDFANLPSVEKQFALNWEIAKCKTHLRKLLFEAQATLAAPDGYQFLNETEELKSLCSMIKTALIETALAV